MAFPPRFLDELRERVSLAEVVGHRVKLIRRGREFVGLCPFHNEKTPSFNVVEDKAFFHCFGCGAHGDAIGFLMQTENLSFREAVEQLAKRAGLEVPRETPAEQERQRQAATLYDVCEAACELFHQYLKESGGRRGLEYLRRRGLSTAAIDRYRLGWAPDTRDALKRALVPRFSEDLLLSAGLLRKPEHGASYDFFRGRVVFPIANRLGKVIGFGARTMGDDEPKYLNSPDTPIFDKGHTLYGLNWAREASKSEWPPIVVEGYMDVISLHEAGFPRSVAPLGTALTEYQLLELWKLAPDPVVCFDGDAAGQRAATRALDRALPQLKPESSLRFVTLPVKEDPDSFVRNTGKQAFEDRLKSAGSISEFLWELAKEQKQESFYDTPEKVLRLEARFNSRINNIVDRNTQREYKNFLNDRIWELRQRLRQLKIKKKSGDKALLRSAASTGSGADIQRRNIETVLLAMCIHRPAIPRREIESLTSIEFTNDTYREIWQVILQEITRDQQPDSQELMQSIYERFLGDQLDRVLESGYVQLHSFLLFGEELPALNFWAATVDKARLPKLQEQLEEAVQRWMLTGAAEDETTVSVFRQLVSECETESPYVEANWEGIQPPQAGDTVH